MKKEKKQRNKETKKGGNNEWKRTSVLKILFQTKFFKTSERYSACPHVSVLTYAFAWVLFGSQSACQSVCTLPFRPCLSLSPLYFLPSPFLSLHLLYVSIPSYSLSLNLLKFLAFLSLSLTQTSSPSLPLFSLSSDLTLRPLPHPLPPTSSLYIFSFHAVSSLRHPPTLPPILPTARSNTIVLR